ncbi:unnamed protein product, partial [Mesorhabditis spiculigera]
MDLEMDEDDVEDLELADSSDEKQDLNPELPDEKPNVKFATKEVVKRKVECDALQLGNNSTRGPAKKKNAHQKSTDRFGMAMDRAAAISAHCNHRRVQRRKLAVLKQESRARKQRLNRGPMGITELRQFASSLTTAQQALKNSSVDLHEAQKKLKEMIDAKTPKNQLGQQRKRVNQARNRQQNAWKRLKVFALESLKSTRPGGQAKSCSKQESSSTTTYKEKYCRKSLEIFIPEKNQKSKTKRDAKHSNSTTLRADGLGIDAKATSYQECMTIACLCKFWNGTSSPNCHYKKLPLTKAVRKEYHTLTDVERNRYHAALKTLKKKGVYDVFATFHAKASNAMNAHHGPAFLPWHRELLKRYELELRKIDPRVSLPYWLSSVNNYAPREPDFPWRSRQQITFSPKFMGSAVGPVKTGPAAGWNRTDRVRLGFDIYDTVFSSGPLTRNAGDRNAYFVLTNAALILEYANDYTWVFRTPPPYMETCTTDWFKSTQPSFEVYHGYGHMTVGGDMNVTATAGADPLFFMHHANYDQLFETWRQKWQDRDERETQYPSDDIISECTSATHQAAVAMEPFTNLRVIDGLSNLYTDELYEYAPAPSCSVQKPDCGSPYLFCSLSNTTWWETQVAVNCLAKMMPGGECSHFVSGEKPCYQGKCVNGICVKT